MEFKASVMSSFPSLNFHQVEIKPRKRPQNKEIKKIDFKRNEKGNLGFINRPHSLLFARVHLLV